MSDTFEEKPEITRVELIDHREGSKTFGRAFWAWDVGRVSLAIQDDGRTLKVFLADRHDEPSSKR